MRVVISTGALCGAGRALGVGITPILAFLLVVLTPVGAGQGVHQGQLLDPVFPHLHFQGNVVRRSSSRPPVPVSVPTRPQGVALGAAAGAADASLSAGLSPVVPGRFDILLDEGLVWRIRLRNAAPAGTFADPPPDPPPTLA